MKQEYYRKIEKYLYYLYEPKVLENEIRQSYIDSMNLSPTAWLRGANNSFENQVIKMLDSIEIKELGKWVEFLKNLLTFFKQKNQRYYSYIWLKYIKKRKDKEIKEVMKLNNNDLKELKEEVMEVIYNEAILKELIIA